MHEPLYNCCEDGMLSQVQPTDASGLCPACRPAASAQASPSIVQYVAHFAMDGTPANSAAEKVLEIRERAAIQAALPRGEEPTTVGRALDNCRMYAAKHRKEEWAKNILRLCADGGSVPSPLRANSPLAVGPYPHCHGEGCTEEGDPEIGSAKMECDLCDGTGAAPTVKWEYRQRNPQTGETLGPWFSCSAKGAERAKACGYEVRATPPAAAGAAIPPTVWDALKPYAKTMRGGLQFTMVESSEVPADEVHVRDALGFTVARIIGIGSPDAAAGEKLG